MKRIASLLILLTSALVLALPAVAQQENHQATTSPLVQLLQSKGILTPEEVATVSQASSPTEADKRLAQLLVEKGLISEQEYKATYTTTPVAASGSSAAHLVNAVLRVPEAQSSGQAAPAPAAPSVVPAVAPLRVLPIDAPKQGGLIPDIKLGSGASMKATTPTSTTATSVASAPASSRCV